MDGQFVVAKRPSGGDWRHPEQGALAWVRRWIVPGFVLAAALELRHRYGTKFAPARTGHVRAQAVQVTIVASSAETLDGLQAYLSRAGLGARCTRELVGAHAAPCSAVVFFPDDFLLEEVIHALERLWRERPSVLPLVITGEPERYLRVALTEGTGRALVVMPRPAWGWMILDAIRSGQSLT